MGEIYVSPFVEIMNQVQCYFPHASISLPEPEPSSIAETHDLFWRPSVVSAYPLRGPFASISAGGTNQYLQASEYLHWPSYTSWSPPTMPSPSLCSASTTYSPSIFSADTVGSAYSRASSEVECSSDLPMPSPFRRRGMRTGPLSREAKESVLKRRSERSVCVRCKFTKLSVSTLLHVPYINITYSLVTVRPGRQWTHRVLLLQKTGLASFYMRPMLLFRSCERGHYNVLP